MRFLSYGIVSTVCCGVLSVTTFAQPSGDRNPLLRADANGDGKVSFEELKAVRPQMERAAFDRLDRDGNGYLDGKDREGGPSPQDNERLQRADKNGDGTVTREEFAAAFPNAPEEAFQRADRNGDGVLDRRDGNRGESADGARNMGRQLIEADTDGDGRISRDEAQSALPRMNDTLFGRLDGNSDGFLDRDEMRRAAQSNDRPANRERAPKADAPGPSSFLISRADGDGDGAVTYDELVAAKPGFPRENFDRLDRNGDGVLRAGE